MQVEVGGGRTVNLNEPTRPGPGSGLIDWVVYWFTQSVYKILEIMGGALGTFIGSALVTGIEIVEPELIQYVEPLIDEVLGIGDLPDWLETLLLNIKSAKDPAGAMLGMQLLGGAASAGLGTIINAPLSVLGRAMNRRYRPTRGDAFLTTQMMWRGVMDSETWAWQMRELGFMEEDISRIEQTIPPRVAVGDLLSYRWRHPEYDDYIRDELRKRGYGEDDITIFLDLATLIPGPGDLVRFALREVWKPDMRAEQLSPNAPGEYYEWMQKVGFSREHAESFWAAHWVLPGVRSGYEMFWRLDEFTEADLRALMTRLDILPKYHDGLIKIAHPPISRVDIRRIYRDLPAGSVDVYKRHLDLGYSPEDAELMTAWVEKEYVADITEPLKSDILGAYGDDLIGRDAAYQMLMDIGTDPWAAEVALDRKDIAKAKKLQGERIRQVKTLYVNDDYNRVDVHSALGALNLPSIRIDRLLEEWDITRIAKVARPSVAKLEGYFFRDIIDRSTFIEYLERHKYADPYLSWAVADIEARKMEALIKEEERAAKELERITALEIKTEYQEAKANINYRIAELKAQLLDIRLYVERLIEGPEGRQVMDIIKAAQVEVTRILAEIAEKRTNLTTQKVVLRTLAVPPDMDALYDIIDDAQIAISTEQSAIAELRAVITEAKGQIRRALPGAEVEDQRLVIDAILIDIAQESEEIAKLRLVIAARKSELAEVWTSEDIAALEEEMRGIKLTIATLEAERARLLL